MREKSLPPQRPPGELEAPARHSGSGASSGGAHDPPGPPDVAALLEQGYHHVHAQAAALIDELLRREKGSTRRLRLSVIIQVLTTLSPSISAMIPSPRDFVIATLVVAGISLAVLIVAYAARLLGFWRPPAPPRRAGELRARLRSFELEYYQHQYALASGPLSRDRVFTLQNFFEGWGDVFNAAGARLSLTEVTGRLEAAAATAPRARWPEPARSHRAEPEPSDMRKAGSIPPGAAYGSPPPEVLSVSGRTPERPDEITLDAEPTLLFSLMDLPELDEATTRELNEATTREPDEATTRELDEATTLGLGGAMTPESDGASILARGEAVAPMPDEGAAPEQAEATAAELEASLDTPAASDRLVNTGFADRAAPEAALEPSLPLACGASLYFWLEVGALMAQSIEATPTPLPVEHLPSSARLTVALFGYDGELELTPGADVGELELRPSGPILVRRQPIVPHGIDLESPLLARRMFFPVGTPEQPGVYRLRCNIYHQQVLVQSRVIRARVEQHPSQLEGAVRSVVDYTLSHRLEPVHLAGMGAHRLSLLCNNNDDGTHSFRFFGARNFKSEATFDTPELQSLITQARGALRRATWGDELEWAEGKPYRYEGAPGLEQLKDDLVLLAMRGYRFYDRIINRLAGGYDAAIDLQDLMLEPGLVQIALKESPRYVLPAALIYDYPLRENAGPTSFYTLCPAFVEGLKGSAPLERTACFQGDCPSRNASSALTTVCPSGFWGFRHSLGMPVSLAYAPDAPATLNCVPALELTVCVSTDLRLELREEHERVLRSLKTGLRWHYADTANKSLEELRISSPHLVYFYCHGGMSPAGQPYLEVGPPNSSGIVASDIRSMRIRWRSTRPLVFINGCHTTAVEPENAFELVTAFVENALASGVIGTEITVFERLARDFAESCLTRFAGGTPIGDAVRQARLALLKRGNPLGLAYIPFVMGGLQLVDTAESAEAVLEAPAVERA